MTNHKKILAVFTALLLVIFTALSPSAAQVDDSQMLSITVEARGSGTATADKYEAIGRYIDSITLTAESTGGEFDHWEIRGKFMFCDSITDWVFNPPMTVRIMPLSDIYAIAWFSDAGEATPDEATPDEATSDEATPDESTPDEVVVEESTPDEATVDQRSIKGKIKTHGSTADQARVDIYEQGSEWTAYSSIAYENEFEFDADCLDPGKYLVKVSKKNHVTREYNVTVADRSLVMDIELCPLGDVNGDGETDIRDCSAALRYIREIDDLDPYQIACGDVSGTGDGELDIQDVSRILRHIREIAMLY